MPGVAPESERTLDFVARNALEVFSRRTTWRPTRSCSIPRVPKAGQNLVRGFSNWLEDIERTSGAKDRAGTERFIVGRDVAATPGKVVMRNDLVELIQYSPTTDTVYAEPILIIPAWIMKYYILDLSAGNSLVRYWSRRATRYSWCRGRTRMPSERGLGMDDYLRLGIAHGRCGVAHRAGPKRSRGGLLYRRYVAVNRRGVLGADGDRRLASVTLRAASRISANLASCRCSSARVNSICWRR